LPHSSITIASVTSSFAWLRVRKWENVLAAIQKPFPALTDLVLGHILGWICTASAVSPVESHSVSGVTGTVLYLQLWNIPHSGFISPEAMATRLSVLTRLKELGLTFKSPRSRSNKPDQGAWRGRRLSLPRRNVLLVLIRFRFRGVSEYLELKTSWPGSMPRCSTTWKSPSTINSYSTLQRTKRLVESV